MTATAQPSNPEDDTSNTGGSREAASTPNPVDVHVGKRVRERRTALGISQERLGEALGVTFQQVQKYERGANRIGASRLYQISRALGVGVSYFFTDLPATATTAPKREMAPNVPMTHETIELTRNYYDIPDVAARRHVYDLIKVLARRR